MSAKDALPYVGHGTPRFEKQWLDKAFPQAPLTPSQADTSPLASEARRLQRDARRAADLAAKLRVQKFPLCQAWPQPWTRTFDLLAGDEPEERFSPELLARLRARTLSGHQAYVALQSLGTRLGKRAAEAQRRHLTQKRKDRAATLADPSTGLGASYRALRGPRAAGPTYLRDPDGHGEAAYTSDPARLDQIARDEWGKVYKGSDEDETLLVSEFCAKYADYMVFQPESNIGPITASDLMRELRTASHTSAGFTGWHQSELAHLSWEAVVQAAELLNAIEAGCPWPEQTLPVRASFVSKAGPVTNPDAGCMDFRVLSVLDVLYRRWGSLRVKQLRPWTRSWASPHLFAGVPGASAQDAWWELGLQVEHSIAAGSACMIGSVDIYKCHDQVSRLLGMMVARCAGLPSAISTAYLSFHGACLYRNAVGAGGVGTPYMRPRGIPQGCPLSSLILAAITQVWVNVVLSHGAIPRALADDWTVSLSGCPHEIKHPFCDALDATHAFVRDMGGAHLPTSA